MRTFITGIIRHFGIKSIFFTYWKRFALIIIIPILSLDILFYYVYDKTLDNKFTSSLLHATTQTYDTMSLMFNNADQIFTTFSQNYYITEFLKKKVDHTYDAGKILDLLQNILVHNENLESVCLYSFNSSYILSPSGGGNVEEWQDKEWMKHYLQTKKSNFIVRDVNYDYTLRIGKNVLSICFGLYNRERLHGLMVLNYATDAFDDAVFPYENTVYYILNDIDTVIYSTNGTFVDENLSAKYQYMAQKANMTLKRDKEYITTAARFTPKSLKLVSVTSLAKSTSSNSHLRLIFSVILLTTIILPTLLSFYFAMVFYRSIAQIITEFNPVEKASTKNKINETSFIIQQISNLSDKKKNIEAELSSKVEILKKAQFSALQLQFNQHFLFNTLNLISLQARIDAKGSNRTSTAISLLSELLRISLDTNQYIVPIAAEISYAKKYIEIEQLKHENIYTVVWNIDEEVYNYNIIKLCFQPIIENAFTHGLQPVSDDHEKRLTITGKIIKDKIVFHFIDNGVGFNSEILEELQHIMNQNILSQSKHIGLSNVNHRIKLIFGEDYGIWITSDENGTDIELTIKKEG